MNIRTNRSFTTSINLKLDIGNKEFVQRYLATPSHAEFLQGIIGGFIEGEKSNAHIMIGPYGSGKSLAATIVADIFSGKINNNDFDKLINKFEEVDQEVYKKLSMAQKSSDIFIPVILSGNEGSFSRTIITSIVKAVKSQGYDIEVPGEVEGINGILEKWELHFPKILSLFKKSLKEKTYTLTQWRKELNQSNYQEIEWFKKEYTALSAGAKFQVDYEANFIDKISYIIEELKKKKIKIFIIYDEFGRFLQSLEVSQIYKTMQDLQDLAEVANRSNNILQLLLISHKNMSQYMLGYNEEFKAEFQRIEKRFKTYFIESDKATFYRIAQEHTKSLQKALSIKNLQHKDSKWILKKYNLFNELNHQEIDKLIVEGSYPLHPIALFLLPRISSIFGQNERTLFTFLESNETGGLNNFVTRFKDEMYYPHNLFDYFFKNSGEEFVADDSFSALKVFKKITNKIIATKENKGQIDLLKMITLWELSSSTSVVKLNKDLLIYGTGQLEEELERNLDELVEQKLLRYNRILKQWELNEGSSVLIDELIEKERATLNILDNTRLDIIKELLEKKFYLATDYNDEKSMTRFMNINVITSEQLLNENFYKEIDFNSDGCIFYIIPLNKKSFHASIKKITSNSDKRLIFSIIDREFKTISTLTDRLFILRSIYNNKKLLSDHNRLDEEISILLAELQFEIVSFMKKFQNFQEESIWFHEGININIRNQVELENIISEIMDKMYPMTPEIRNDAINRRNLNSMQTKAIYNVLNNVIKNPNFQNLGISGQGPDYLIYATVFKNNHLDLSELNLIEYAPYNLIREKLYEYISSSKKGSVKDLELIFSSKPFGIRSPLIPLLFTGLLRDVWEQLMFYRNGMYITAIDAEKLYGIFAEAEEYEFVYNDYSSEFIDFVKIVEKNFKEYESEYVQDQTVVIKASSGILNWLRQLPRYTQTTDEMEKRLLKFKNTIRKVEINPIESLEILQKSFIDMQTLLEMKKSLENHFTSFKKIVTEKLFDIFSVDSLELLKKQHNSYSANTLKRNRLLKSLSFREENFIENFALNYTGVEMQNWSDTTFDLFVRQMQNDYKDIQTSSEDSDIILLGFGELQKSIKRVELSNKANTVYENVNRIINNAGRSVPREEIEYLVFKLLDKYIE